MIGATVSFEGEAGLSGEADIGFSIDRHNGISGQAGAEVFLALKLPLEAQLNWVILSTSMQGLIFKPVSVRDCQLNLILDMKR